MNCGEVIERTARSTSHQTESSVVEERGTMVRGGAKSIDRLVKDEDCYFS